jgi:DNA polymerase-3 subunit epsilon
MHFYVLDVETANREASSVCQIGIVEVANGEVIKRWSIFVDPNGPFEYHNVRVHGITEKDVVDAEYFSSYYPLLKSLLSHQYVVQHTNFDQMAIDQSCLKYDLEMLPIKWVDSSRMAHKLWPEYKDCGYGLKALAEIFDIEFKAHDACEDATATAEIVIKTLVHHEMTIESLYHLQLGEAKTIRFENQKLTYKPNPDGPYFGKNICFTGILNSSRKDAMARASALGFRITDRVNFYTHFLVLGKPKRQQHGQKLIKANKLIEMKAPITLLNEAEFLALLEGAES